MCGLSGGKLAAVVMGDLFYFKNMKLKHWNRTGMVLALIGLSACSKESGQPAAVENPSHQDASIRLLNLYSTRTDQHGGFYITELENTGKVGITAFQGKWTVKDDLDATIRELDIRYTSDTPYLTPGGDKSPHVISAGEKFIILYGGGSSEEDKTYAAAKENITNIGFPGLTLLFQVKPLEDYRVTKKTTFELEKVVTQ